jgi:hypothetical protein
MLKPGDIVLTNIQFTDTFEVKKNLQWFYSKNSIM